MLGALWLLFRRTRWGVLVRAATLDREMAAALGVNQKWLFTSVFALGVFLAAFGGALALPREAANHTMDLQVIAEALVVVVIGGLGSVPGTFLAAVIVSELNAFGILVLPGVSLALAFAVMAIVLVVRPSGLMGAKDAPARPTGGEFPRWRPWTLSERAVSGVVIALVAALPLVAGPYWLGVASEVFIFALFAASLHFLVGAGGLISFGHAAYFGLGSYGAALALKSLGLSMGVAIAAGVALGLAGALVFGWFCVRNSGVYAAMLTLAFAEVAWSIAFQWSDVTGGDNGVIGVWPSGWASTPAHFFWLTLTLAVLGVAALRIILFSPFGYALRAVRDNEARAEAIGIATPRRAVGGLRHRRRLCCARRGALCFPQRQRVSRHPRHPPVDRRAGDGAARRRRHGDWRRHRRRRVPHAFDLGDQPHRLFPSRHRARHRRAGGAVSARPGRRLATLFARARGPKG